jgi:murein DD-endopeptidase MepM/ murein hydrolase activator NlpD
MKKILWFLAGLAAMEITLQSIKKRNSQKGYGELIRSSNNSILPSQNAKFISRPITKGYTKHSWKRFFKEQPIAIGLLGTALLMIVFQSGMQKFSDYFQASTIEWEQQVDPFDGSVYPIEKVPNWVALSDQERTMTFQELPDAKKISLPAYNVSAMRIGMTWRGDNELERNTYITYPVPNLGNYQLDATENSGSHTGLDIKTLIGTPVHTISRGIVIKSENQPTGFGQFILILHTNVPDPENPGEKTNLYSVYAHLSKRIVHAGDTVEKGEIIGETGMSGMATAPHLHFQIDRDDAPFHPYWPFTWKDLQGTNISSYFEAVKQGVNADRAKEFTVHPMDLVASTLDYDLYDTNLIVSADPTFVPTPIETHAAAPVETIVEKTTEPTVTIDDTKAVIASANPSYVERITSTGRRSRLLDGENIKVETDRTFRPGTPEIFDVVIADDTLVASAGIEIGTTLKDFAQIQPTILTKNDFIDGVAQVEVTTDSSNTFKLIASGDFGEVRSQSLRAQIFEDVSASNKYQEAIAFVQQKKIMTGYGDGSFLPDGQLNRAEAVKILITANELNLLPAGTNFPDVDASAWYAQYVATALARGLVKGYGDGEFKPGNTISRAEFLKIALEAANIDIPQVVTNPYPDVDSQDWFAPYFSIAAEYELLPAVRGGNILPHQAITRAEAANVIWNVLQLKR